ncbi:phenylacetate--CoA ligase family protein [Alishewanella jeotgali]|nr:phenylacetate--CoA ligase family protein [Alishewanella jeotgali]
MSKILRSLISHIAFPLHELLKGHNSTARRKQLEMSQWLSAEDLKKLQNRNLNSFINQVYLQVPYYRQLMQQRNLLPSQISSAEDLVCLPFLTKADIGSHFEQLRAHNASKLKRYNTGGSSGQPLIFLIDKQRVSHDVAAKWRATRWWGVDIGDKEIVAWGSPIELGAQDKLRLWRDRLFRSSLIPAFDLTEQKLLQFLVQIQTSKPAMLFGYPSVFYLMAQTAQQQQIDMTQLGIKVVFVTSERLYPYQRELIQQVFGAPVANGYGGRDAGFIAHECPAGNMHISAEDIIVEIIGADEKPVATGQSGEIVVTHLATGAFPFIRYRTGDIGSLSEQPCSCGRCLPVLATVEGRSTDFVVAANGTKMHGLALIYILRDIPGIAAFKIIQHSLSLTTVQLVWPEGLLPEEVNRRIRTAFNARLGAEVQIEIEQLDEIGPEKSGKFRYVISKVCNP